MATKPGKKFVTAKTAKRRHSITYKTASSGQFVTVVLKSRGGKTVSVPPAAAKVLEETEQLRERVSRGW